MQLHDRADLLTGGSSSSAGNARAPAAAAREGVRFGRWSKQLSWQWAIACCSCMGRCFVSVSCCLEGSRYLSVPPRGVLLLLCAQFLVLDQARGFLHPTATYTVRVLSVSETKKLDQLKAGEVAARRGLFGGLWRRG